MANTLNLGNGNWGVKDSSLLGYKNRQNGRFLPETFDVARGSAGTRVNQSGLIESVTEILSADLVINGDFTTDTDWTLSSGITYNASKYLDFNLSSGQAKNTPNITFVQGKTYKVVYEIKNYVSGTIKFRFQNGTNTIGSAQSGDGVKTEFIICLDNSNNNFQFFGSSSFVGSIDNVSVVEVNRDNLARIDYLDDAAGVLLTEPQSTNLFLNSEPTSIESASSNITYESFDWGIGFSNCIIYGVSSYHYGGQCAASTEYTVSAFVRMDDLSEPMIGEGASNDLRLVIGGSTASTNITKTQFSNNIWRISATKTSGTSSLFFNGVRSLNGSGKGFKVTGLQLEELSYSTSYIPTEGVAATRLADVVNNAGDVNNFNSEEGVLFIETILQGDGARRITLSDGTSSNRVLLNWSSDTALGIIVSVSGSTVATLNYNSTFLNVNRKYAVKYKENDFALWVDGVEVATDNSGVTAPNGTLSNLSFNSTNSNHFEGSTKSLQVFDEALTDIELQTLTTI